MIFDLERMWPSKEAAFNFNEVGIIFIETC